MSAYLFTWNPAKYQFSDDDLDYCLKRSRSGKSVRYDWSCSNSKKIARGDRAFLIKLGMQGRGIFASGWIIRGSHVSKESDFGPQGVDVEWDAFLDPRHEASLLAPFDLPGKQHWTPQNSGAAINSTSHVELELRWAAHLSDHGRTASPREAFSDEELLTELDGVEGALLERIVRHRRRERSLRNAKLVQHRGQHGSLACEACRFDFQKAFGLEYAEVHHVRPLSTLSAPTVTKLSDLVVLCANCHRIAHLDPKRPKSLAQLRRMRSQ